jgi:hypothetical protein
MDKDRELAGKVDALLDKHGVAKRAGEKIDDRNVPVLTDLVEAPEWSPPRVDTADALRRLSELELDALSHDIFTRVFDRIDTQLAAKLEDRLTQQLSGQINSAVTHVLGDLRQDIANEVGDAVNAVLADLLRKK